MPKGQISRGATPTQTGNDEPEGEPADPSHSNTRGTPRRLLGEGQRLRRALSTGVMQMIAVTAALVALGLVLFHLFRWLVWVCAEAWAHIGAIGWVALIPLGIWFIFETVKSCAEPKDTSELTAGKRWRKRGMAILAVGLVMAGNGCLSIAASRVDRLWTERKPYTTELYKNQDLARLVGQCIRLAILRHAEQLGPGPEQKGLQELAQKAPRHWADLTDSADPRALALGDAELTQFISKPRAEALNQEAWLKLLSTWRDLERSSPLSDATLSDAAAVVAADFGITLREALKADFEKGGKAWAAMQLDLVQLLIQRSDTTLARSEETARALREVKALLRDDGKGLPSLQLAIETVRRSHDEHSRRVVDQFDRLNASLERFEAGLADLRGNVADLRSDTSATRQIVSESATDLKDVKSLLQEIRSAPSQAAVRGSAARLNDSELSMLERDFDEYVRIRWLGNSTPYFKANAPLRYRAWRRGAEAGHAKAMVLWGRALQEGLGVQQDQAVALKWFERAADRGNAAGLFNVAMMHELGEGGLPENQINATRLFAAAAEKGHAGSMAALGRSYRWGLGHLAEDKDLAATWFQRAIDLGDTNAMCDLANMYVNGDLGRADENSELSDRLYRRAAKAGSQVAKGVLAGQVVGAAFEAYFAPKATRDEQATAVRKARESIGALASLDAEGLLNVLRDSKIRPFFSEIRGKSETDPMKVVHQEVVELLIARFRKSALMTRKRLLKDFAASAESTVKSWSKANEHQRVAAFWQDSFSDIRLAEEIQGEWVGVLSLLAPAISSLYAVGYREDATQQARDAYALTDAVLEDRPWDWFVRIGSTDIGWIAGAALIELGRPEAAQVFLRRAWNATFWLYGRDDLIDKYQVLPVRGAAPPDVEPEDAAFFADIKPTDSEEPSPLKSMTIPFDFGGEKQSIKVFFVPGSRGYAHLQDQFLYMKEYKGGIVPTQIEESFRQLNKVAVEENVDFLELCMYALESANSEGTAE